MSITFKSLNESHFPLLLQWLEAPHVKKWWDRDATYNMELIQEKYSSYVKGYKLVNGKQKSIKAFIIYCNQSPVGYIQIYNAYDFPRSKPLFGLPGNLGAFDIFIGEEKALRQGLGSLVISEFLGFHGGQYSHIFVDPDINNIAAVKCYKKAGFKKLSEQKSSGEVWMILDNINILEELKSREPIFHHPDKFGKTQQDIENQICDEFWEVGASGNIYTRKDVIEGLVKRYNDPNYKDIWKVSDFKLTQIAVDNYLLTYNLTQNNSRYTRRSTIWRRVNGDWKILYHQGTVIESAKK